MRSAVQSRHDAERTSSNPHDELKRYMESPLEDVADVIGWWGVSDHQTVSCTITNTIVASHHTVSDTLEDGKLAIQGSATPSEHAFSSGGTTGTAKRNRLKPEVFEALQLLKGGYRNGHIAADKDANEHLHSSDDDVPVDDQNSK